VEGHREEISVALCAFSVALHVLALENVVVIALGFLLGDI